MSARKNGHNRTPNPSDPQLGLMITAPGDIPASLLPRDTAERVRHALREAHANEWEFARIPCCVLRDLYDLVTQAAREERYACDRVPHTPHVSRVG